MVTRTPGATTLSCLSRLKEGGAGPTDTPRGRHLSYKPLLPTHSLRRYTHTMIVTCHFTLGCYTSALTIHIFVPSSFSTHTASDVTYLLKVNPHPDITPLGASQLELTLCHQLSSSASCMLTLVTCTRSLSLGQALHYSSHRGCPLYTLEFACTRCHTIGRTPMRTQMVSNSIIICSLLSKQERCRRLLQPLGRRQRFLALSAASWGKGVCSNQAPAPGTKGTAAPRPYVHIGCSPCLSI